MIEDNADEIYNADQAYELSHSREAMIAAAAHKEDLVGNTFKLVDLIKFCERRDITILPNSLKADIIAVIVSENNRRRCSDQEEPFSDRHRTMSHASSTSLATVEPGPPAVNASSLHTSTGNTSTFRAEQPDIPANFVHASFTEDCAYHRTTAATPNNFCTPQMTTAAMSRNFYTPPTTTIAPSYYPYVPQTTMITAPYDLHAPWNAQPRIYPPTSASEFQPDVRVPLQTHPYTTEYLPFPTYLSQPSQQYRAIPDLSKFVEVYEGSDDKNATRWLERLERILASYRVNPEEWILVIEQYLKGNARRWHDSIGRSFVQWGQWRSQFLSFFSRPVDEAWWNTQLARTRKRSEDSLRDYALQRLNILDKYPGHLTEQGKISYLLNGITEDKFMYLKGNHYSSLTELMILLSHVDKRTDAGQDILKKQKNDDRSQSNKKQDFPSLYRKGDDLSCATCFNCSEMGHLSINCPKPKTEKTKKAHEKRESREANKENRPTNQVNKNRSVNCILTSECEPLSIVEAEVNDQSAKALLDNGSTSTLIRPKFVKSTDVTPSSDRIIACGKDIAATIQGRANVKIRVASVGPTQVPRAIITDDLPPNCDIILGKDWQTLAQVTVTVYPSGSIRLLPVKYDRLDNETTIHVKETNECNADMIISQNIVSNCCNIIDNTIIEINSVEITPSLDSEIKRTLTELTNYLTDDKIRRIESILRCNIKAIASSEKPLGESTGIEHCINLTDEVPINSSPYRYAKADREFIKQEIRNWYNLGIARPSTSPYASPVVLVNQPHHKSTPRRLCVDYRKLNAKTQIPTFPMPIITDVIADMAADSSKYFNTMDVAKAFLTIRVREKDIAKTAFITQDDKGEFLRMSFGMSGAPATMLMKMIETFSNMPRTVTYMDDIGQGARSQDEAIDLFESALQQLSANGLSIHLSKCQIVKESVNFLGYIVSGEGIRADPDRINDVDKFQPTTSKSRMISFIQFLNYYRRFIKDFAKLVHHLRQITRPDADFIITDEHEKTIKGLVNILKSRPLLHHFKHERPTSVYVDACQEGLGAVLVQQDNGGEVPIEFASKTVSDRDQRILHSNMLECMAVHWAITERFRIYLYGLSHFDVYTDNFAVSYLVKSGATNRRFARWVVDLAEFNFSIRHISGKKNIPADLLSRTNNNLLRTEETICCTIKIIAYHPSLQPLQQEDKFCKKIMIDSDNSSSYILDSNGILTRREEKANSFTIVLPQSLVPQLIKAYHEAYGHPDAKRTMAIMRRKFYAPNLQRQIVEYVSLCHVCQIMNRRTTKLIGYLKPREIPDDPNSVISIDHFGPLPQIRQYKHVLLILDHATRFAEAVPTRSTSTKETKRILIKHWFDRFGLPASIVSDNATGYTSREMEIFLTENNINHELSPPYNPESNGLIERLVQTIKNILRKTMVNKDWVSILPSVVMRYNATYGRSTQESPFYLMHGYHPRTCMQDQLIAIKETDLSRIKSIHELLHRRAKAKTHLTEITSVACEKKNEHRRPSTMKPGDKVLTEICESGAFHPRWEGPYTIKKIENDIATLTEDDGRILRRAKLRQLRPFKEIPQPEVIVCEDANMSSGGRVATAAK